MNIETLKQKLADFGLSPNKTYGQNFLMDEIVLQDMVDEAEVNKDDIVIEVGPGIGNLTSFLIAKAKQVIAIEKDDQFVSVLNHLKNKNKNFNYQLSDILHTDIANLVGESKYKVVANIPYYITGKIIQKFLSLNNKPQSLTLLVQKEVAQNLSAPVGKLNLLAISVQLYADVKMLTVVPAMKFYPAPKVDSAVVQIILHDHSKYVNYDEKKLFKILKACFLGKRKQLHNTLVNNLKLEKTVVETVLDECNISANSRPQQLSIDQWINLSNKINL